MPAAPPLDLDTITANLDFWQAIGDLLQTLEYRRQQASLLDHLSDAVIAVDLAESITYLNAAVAQYGVDPAAALGQP